MENQIMPTVGRVVYYKTIGSADGVFHLTDFVSLITKVYDIDTVSLVTFSEQGMRFEVKVSRGNEAGQWNWMPYQIKTNAVNSQSAEPRLGSLQPRTNAVNSQSAEPRLGSLQPRNETQDTTSIS